VQQFTVQNIVGNRDVSFALASIKVREFVKVVTIEIYGFMASPVNKFLKSIIFYSAELPCEERDIIFPL
jgi:hypothetical protein